MTPKTKRERNQIFNMRRNRRLLQKQLAVLLGHRYTYMISKYEHGIRLPPLETALLLEIALGVRLPEMYPDLYRAMQALVLVRCQRLPADLRRGIEGRLLGKDHYDDT
jgi:transcriptional regulator with XRE-family HTH domain